MRVSDVPGHLEAGGTAEVCMGAGGGVMLLSGSAQSGHTQAVSLLGCIVESGLPCVLVSWDVFV